MVNGPTVRRADRFSRKDSCFGQSLRTGRVAAVARGCALVADAVPRGPAQGHLSGAGGFKERYPIMPEA